MADRCSCGSRYPRGASFCPNCGRPLVEGLVPEVGAEVEPPSAEEPSPAPSATLPDCFRAAIPPAVCGVLLRFGLGLLAPVLAPLAFLVMIPAGSVAVRRLSRSVAPVGSAWQGFGVGALTGLLCFVPSLVVQVASHVAQGRQSMLEVLRRQLEGSPMADALMSALDDPAVFAAVIALGLFVEACGLVVIAGAGGALAAWTEIRSRD